MTEKMILSTTFLAFISMAVSCGSSNTPEPVLPEEPATSGGVRVITTTSDRAKDLTESFVEFSKNNNITPTLIRLLPEEEYQTMDGFGAAVTGKA